MINGNLRVIPLGGLGEIGRNLLLLEYDEQLLVIDAGLMFPNNDMLGIDIVIPDLSYVLERADQVRAVVVTHGHEDHTGALPYLLETVKAPVYATALTRGLIEVKLRESRVRDAELHTIAPGNVLELPPFSVEFFHMSHSIPDGVGLGVRTPVGLVVHSGDFKFDHSPVDGHCCDFGRLATLGNEGVLLLLSDSTNAEQPGYTPSERVIGETLARTMGEAPGRVIVATFASNISRIQQIADISMALGRRLAVVGRSMVNNVRIARELGYLHIPEETMIAIDQIERFPARELTLVCTGSQGEPTSALVRMGRGDYRSVSIVSGDTVIVSATPIPGNEELVNHTLDNLFRLGADVYYDELLNVHVSGHASQEEQKLLINLLRPRYFVPIHGEYRHLVLHGKLAQQCGMQPESIFVLQSGDVLELDGSGAEVIDHVSDEYVFVDRLGIGNGGQAVLEDRRLLSQNGFLVAVVSLDKYTGSVVGEPHIVTRGFIYDAEVPGVLERAREEIGKAVSLGGSRVELQERLQSVLSRFAYEHTGRRPVVVPIITKV